MPTLAVLFITLHLAIIVIMESDGMFLPKRITPYLNAREKIIMDPKKRPFCNAFTGCGRKRSNLPALTHTGEEVENPINSLLELSAEPAVEDLSRQIMSEAKLWEAIQEANLEVSRHKHQPINNGDNEDIGLLDRSAASSCALPPCYI
ncbi:cardioactive peptide [Anthonomus grandis grandis]|uniref:cardioactive peptide n=1 Tax=Anthonomus grandis grandis TaxID=2921223 RepID=UPI002165BC41|nr:cardioactive peptide [Anthonomus grandis grandis]XP_050299293.1 cardioactive peptide [Anthonomus grandis grandis]XP_050299302.1 cardioactive peptide [Anthonomus grandis grandis]